MLLSTATGLFYHMYYSFPYHTFRRSADHCILQLTHESIKLDKRQDKKEYIIEIIGIST